MFNYSCKLQLSRFRLTKMTLRKEMGTFQSVFFGIMRRIERETERMNLEAKSEGKQGEGTSIQGRVKRHLGIAMCPATRKECLLIDPSRGLFCIELGRTVSFRDSCPFVRKRKRLSLIGSDDDLMES